MRSGRRGILLLALVAVPLFLLLWATWLEPRRLVIRDVSLDLPRLPPGGEIRIAAVSDLHTGSPHHGITTLRRIVAATNALAPDLVLLLGDFVIQGVLGGEFVAPEDIAAELAALRARSGVFAVLGNHDWWLDGPRVAASLERQGIRVLEDAALPVEVAGRRLWLAGVSDYWEGDHDIDRALQDVPRDSAAIVFTHNPDIFPDVPSWVALTIAGHTHGGQVDLPFIGPPIVPSEFGQRYASGSIVEDGRHLFVTTGTGTSILPVRFRVPPEITLLSLGSDRVAFATAQPCAHEREDATIRRHFDDLGVVGTFVLLNLADGTCVRFAPERARTRFPPASTFKIFNTLVALDEGSIADAGTVLEWDGVDRGRSDWNADQDMRTAFRRSTVWFYQELARRTGEPRMRAWLERERYGNADPSGGIDRFWLMGGLRISADEQVEFLRRLQRRELGFSARAQQIAAELLVMETTAGYTLAGKTGWTEYEGRQLGWYVGQVSRDGVTWIYALNFESPDPEFPMQQARETLLRRLLSHVGIL